MLWTDVFIPKKVLLSITLENCHNKYPFKQFIERHLMYFFENDKV